MASASSSSVPSKKDHGLSVNTAAVNSSASAYDSEGHRSGLSRKSRSLGGDSIDKPTEGRPRASSVSSNGSVGGAVQDPYTSHAPASNPVTFRSVLWAIFEIVGTHETNKRVRVMDGRIAAVRWIALICILSYTIGYEIVYSFGYCAWHSVSGHWHMLVHQPAVDASLQELCDFHGDEFQCTDDFSKRSSLPYCCKEGCIPIHGSVAEFGCMCDGRTKPWQKSLPCWWGDHISAVQAFDQSYLISSYEFQEDQYLNGTCFDSETCENLWLSKKQHQFFIADLERFEVAIDHVVHQSTMKIEKTTREMKGFLHVSGTEPSQEALCQQMANRSSPCDIKPRQMPGYPLDVFKLRTLLAAAGIGDLDVLRYPTSKITPRQAGLVLQVVISYSNWDRWKGISGKVEYRYQVSALGRDNFQFTKAEWHNYPRERRVRNIHGVLLRGTQEGRLAQFSLVNTLLRLVICVNLITALHFAIDFYAHYISKEAPYLRACDFEYFSLKSVRKLQGKSDEELRDMLHARGLPSGGLSPRRIARLVADDGLESNDHYRQEIELSALASSFLGVRQ